ncbi:hypothetical protein ACRRTK_001228 [Alexandromys fortis]
MKPPLYNNPVVEKLVSGPKTEAKNRPFAHVIKGNAWGTGGTEQTKDAQESEHRLGEGMHKFQTILQKREHSQFNGNVLKAMKDNKDKTQLQKIHYLVHFFISHENEFEFSDEYDVCVENYRPRCALRPIAQTKQIRSRPFHLLASRVGIDYSATKNGAGSTKAKTENQKPTVEGREKGMMSRDPRKNMFWRSVGAATWECGFNGNGKGRAYKVLSRKCVEGEAKRTKFQAVLIFKELAEKVFTESTERGKMQPNGKIHMRRSWKPGCLKSRFLKGGCGQYQQRSKTTITAHLIQPDLLYCVRTVSPASKDHLKLNREMRKGKNGLSAALASTGAATGGGAEGGGERKEAKGRARAAGSPRSAQLGTGGRRTQRGKITAALTVALLDASRGTGFADIVTADDRGSAPRVRDPVLHPCLCRERRMRTSSRTAPAVPLATRTRTLAAAPDRAPSQSIPNYGTTTTALLVWATASQAAVRSEAVATGDEAESDKQYAGCGVGTIRAGILGVTLLLSQLMCCQSYKRVIIALMVAAYPMTARFSFRNYFPAIIKPVFSDVVFEQKQQQQRELINPHSLNQKPKSISLSTLSSTPTDGYPEAEVLQWLSQNIVKEWLSSCICAYVFSEPQVLEGNINHTHSVSLGSDTVPYSQNLLLDSYGTEQFRRYERKAFITNK